VSTTPIGTPVDPRNFYSAFQTRCRRAGVPDDDVCMPPARPADLCSLLLMSTAGGHANTAPQFTENEVLMSVSPLIEFELWGKGDWPRRDVVGDRISDSCANRRTGR
jgi:hypothetical protein